MKLRKTYIFILGFLALGLGFAFWGSPQPPDWRLTHGMITPRREHQAICLKDGRVLVFGGVTADFKPVLSCELFDPVHETWSSAGTLHFGTEWTPLPGAVCHGEAHGVVLPDGRVLVTEKWWQVPVGYWGGFIPSPDSICQIFDPKTGGWSSLPKVDEFQWIGALIPSNDGRIFVYSRSYISSGQARLYNPSTNSWSEVLNCPDGLICFIGLPDGRVLGMRASPLLNQLFDPSLKTWSPCARMRSTSGWGTSLPNGTAFYLSEAFADPKVRIYDPKSNAWSKYGSARVVNDTANFQATHLDLTQLKNGNILMAGGPYLAWDPWKLPMIGHSWSQYSSYYSEWCQETKHEAVSECHLYNWKTNEWRRTGPLLQPREFHATTLLNDGRVLVTGGVDSAGKLITTCEIGTISENP